MNGRPPWLASTPTNFKMCDCCCSCARENIPINFSVTLSQLVYVGVDPGYATEVELEESQPVCEECYNEIISEINTPESIDENPECIVILESASEDPC